MSQWITKGWENIDCGEALLTGLVYGVAAYGVSKIDTGYGHNLLALSDEDQLLIESIHSVLSNIFTFFKDIFANIINKTVKKVSNTTNSMPKTSSTTSESSNGGDTDLSQLGQAIGMLPNHGTLNQVFYGFKPSFR